MSPQRLPAKAPTGACRLSIDLDEAMASRLEAIRTRSGARSWAEVIRLLIGNAGVKQEQGVAVGDVIVIGGRRLRVSGMPDGVTLCRDHRKRIGLRNIETNRLSYMPEWQVLQAKKVEVA